MQFFQVVLSGAALIASAMAVSFDFQTLPTSLEAGKSYTVSYSPKDSSSTTIKLQKGSDPNNLSGSLIDVATLTTATSGSATFTIPSNLVSGPGYALVVVQGSEVNYSGLLALTGGSASSSSSAVASSSASSYSKVSASSYSSAVSSAASSYASASKTSASTMTTSASSAGTTASASGAPSHSAGSNSTISGTSRTPSATGATPPQQTTNGAGMIASSPVAIIVCAFAAMAYLI